MPFSATCIDLDVIIEREVSQRERQTLYDTYTWNLKIYDTCELIYKTKISSNTKKQAMVTKEEHGGDK